MSKTTLYSIKQASQILKRSSSFLYVMHQRGLIEFISKRDKNHLIKFYLDQTTLIHLQIKLNQNPPQYQGLTTLNTYVKKHHVKLNEFKFDVYEAQIKPVIIGHHPIHEKLLPYRITQLDQILYQAQQKKRNQKKQAYRDLQNQPNIKRLFNPNIDYTPSQLSQYLNHANHNSIFQWVKYERIPYSVDQNQKYFFTQKQAESIKSKYKKVPPGYHTNQELANYLGVNNQKLSRWTSYNLIPHERILGYLGIYYNPVESKYILKNFKKHEVNQKNNIG